MILRFFFLLTITLLLNIFSCGQSPRPESPHGQLHVASPDWGDQVIYFVMTDRFDDGDPSNNDQGAGEFDPRYNSHYSGGDLQGITRRLDYIRALGATAVWITPPVANQWWDPWNSYSGYHGYWALDFTNVDAHYGTLSDYQDLSRALHSRGMYLVQDIVCNHTGNFFDMDGGRYRANTNSKPDFRPSQPPFDLNDYGNPSHRAAHIYNWTPAVKDYQDTNQVLTYQMSGLDDLNTTNPRVIKALKDSFRFWIDQAGVDAYRIDTAIYVDHAFWRDFHHSTNPDSSGIITHARAAGKSNFLTFGETWVNVEPFDDQGDLLAASYQGTPQAPEMPSVINFPLHVNLARVFAEGKPTAILGYSLSNAMRLYSNPRTLVNFVDNHDMNRFLTSASPYALRQALLFILTIPGIPVIYYGTEQMFTETRASMFRHGYGSGGTDHFDTSGEMFRFISNAVRMRLEHAVFRKGRPTVLKTSLSQSGVLAYRMDYGKDTALIILNTSDAPILMDNLATGLPEGTSLRLLAGLTRTDRAQTVGPDGFISLRLMQRSGMVLLSDGLKSAPAKPQSSVRITGFADKSVLSANLIISGACSNTTRVSLLVNGDLQRSIKAEILPGGIWRAVLPAEDLDNGVHTLCALAADPAGELFSVSDSREFTVQIPFIPAGNWQDPTGDDHGPAGRYVYPTDPSFTNRHCDIERVELFRGGRSLRVSVTMARPLSTMWNPKFGFDHVSLSVFLSFPSPPPGNPGSAFMPGQNAVLPAGMKWHTMALLGGWMSYLYSAKGADAVQFGTTISPAPRLNVDPKTRRIDITFSGSSLPGVTNPAGIRVYVAAWDYDGLESSFRKILPAPEAYSFGGGRPGDPLVMDDTGILTVR